MLSVLRITVYPAERIFALDEDLFVPWHGTSAKMVEITKGGIAMAYDISTVDVWAGSIEDRPGSLSEKLQPLVEAGVNLEFVIARRAPENPGTSFVFLAPIQGATQARAAKKAGLGKACGSQLPSIKIIPQLCNAESGHSQVIGTVFSR